MNAWARNRAGRPVQSRTVPGAPSCPAGGDRGGCDRGESVGRPRQRHHRRERPLRSSRPCPAELPVAGRRCASVKRSCEVRMKEPYGEGPASHPDPEPCARNPQGAGRSVGRGTREPGFELRNHGEFGKEWPNPYWRGKATPQGPSGRGPRRRPRSRRPGAREETSGSEPRGPVCACKAGRLPKAHGRDGGVNGTGSRTGVWYLRSDRTKGARFPWRRSWREAARPRRTRCSRPRPGFKTGGAR